jgi:peptide/nickel transport system substrate-binding protein
VHSLDPAGGYGDTNWTGFSDPAIDRLIEGSATTMDMLERRAQLQAVMRRAMDALPLVPLDNPYTLFGAREDLRFEPRRDGMVSLFELRRLPAADRGGG